MPDDAIAAEAARYVAGMEHEVTLLGALLVIARQQREAAQPDASAALAELVVARQHAEDRLQQLECLLGPLRVKLSATPTAHSLSAAVRNTHATARARIAEILAVDRETLEVLGAARGCRQVQLQQLEAGGATLAAYRRVVTPGTASAELFDEVG